MYGVALRVVATLFSTIFSSTDGGDDVDREAVDASIEANIISPLRASGARVPTGLLSREQAWGLAHASEHVASTHDETHGIKL